ncbi:hypothetical protein L228DRAFT_245658 [Xylona heveae TC161]|uniref:Uncharacterized protein n=1 Tax=Xylona heveae (strain CBS 132557 / TC161) TaxID=1328760 RepID=A0A165IBI6_XYLHT|nr:hypothetical protein L228DRAFT_245658 [Xylona heveae TC161]KZF24670.1 hypothetical protein L228DRAFT_245658 [Xylona heveae TC161]
MGFFSSSPSHHHSHNHHGGRTGHSGHNGHNYFIRPSTSTPSYSKRPAFYARSSASSYYKRRPRDGFFTRMLTLIRRWVREFFGYARRHPFKVFFLVILPLITGGALHSLLRQFGIRLPPSLLALGGGGGGQSSRGAGGYMDEYSRYSYSGQPSSSYGGYGGGGDGFFGGGAGNTLGTLMKVAQAFM